MNLLTNIFSEFFGYSQYCSQNGRRYIEYICESGESYKGKICFFHFSPLRYGINAKNSLEILQFIQLFYSKVCKYLYPAIKFSICHDSIISINSLTECQFVIKFQNVPGMTSLLRKMFPDFFFPAEDTMRFYELYIDGVQEFVLQKVKIYQEIPFPSELDTQDAVARENVFMTFQILEDNGEGYLKNEGFLVKLTVPIVLRDSELLYTMYQSHITPEFDENDIFVSFVEFDQTGKNRLIYFTYKYSIPA